MKDITQTKQRNFAFFGTPLFAKIILEKLIKADYIPSVVVTNPDRPVGRKKIITPPSVKQFISSLSQTIQQKIKILQPEKLTPIPEELLQEKFDFLIVAAYSRILKKEILQIPRFGVLGVHPSLLPKYRGPSPIQSALLNGEDETGATIFLMDKLVDNGPILTQERYAIQDNDNYETLTQKLADLGGSLLIKILPDYINEKIESKTQNHSLATFTKKFETKDAFVDLQNENPITILRKIRALNPEPGVYAFYNNKRMKILDAKLVDKNLILTKIQFEGEKPKAWQV